MKIKNRVMEDACLTELHITKGKSVIAMLKIHWSINSGMYGHQIGFMMWIENQKGEYDYSEEITDGCGYCKESQALQTFLSKLNNKYSGGGGSVNYYLGGTKYHKGGNFYKIPLSIINKIIKR